MKITGEILKRSREQQGISIHEVAAVLKISPNILHAMEEGDLERLPKKAFVRGFVQSYAKFLKLDVQNITNAFNEEMGLVKMNPLPEGEKSVLTQSPNMVIGPKKMSWTAKLTLALVVGCIFTAIVVLKKQMEKYRAESHSAQPTMDIVPLPVPSPTVAESLGLGAVVAEEDDANKSQVAESLSSSPADSVNGASLTPAPVAKSTPQWNVTATPTVAQTPRASPSPQIIKPSPTQTLLSNASTKTSPTPRATSTPTSTPKILTTPTGTPRPSPTLSPTPKLSPTPQPSPSASVKPSPTGTPASKITSGQEVIIEALDMVEIEFQIDSETTQKIKLKPDEIYTIRGKKNITLRSTNGGLLSIIHNGKDRGVVGVLGKPLDKKFP